MGNRNVNVSLIILILLSIIILQYYNQRKQSSENYAALSAATDSLLYFKNRIGKVTASVKTLQLEKKQLYSIVIKKDAELTAMAREFAKVKSVIKISTAIKIDTINTKFSHPIGTTPYDSIHLLERIGTINSEWYSLNYKVTNDSLLIAPFEIFTNAKIITGSKRKWFLGKETLTTDVAFSNPNIKITDITAAELTLPYPWYKRWYIWLVIGITGGLLLN